MMKRQHKKSFALKPAEFNKIGLVNPMQVNKYQPKPKILASIIKVLFLTAIQSSAQAVVFNVTESEDDGSGLTEGTLSKAILDANELAGPDTVRLRTNVTLTGVMKRLIDSNLTLKSDTTRRSISGNDQFRPLFIKSGVVEIKNLDITNGLAEGGDSNSGGAGAGMGGALFIYGGKVEINGVHFINSSAKGGDVRQSSSGGGGGGMFGSSTRAGGGLFANASGNSGGYGGYGRYQDGSQMFGTGANYRVNTHHGGFGGGGSRVYDYYQSVAGGSGGFGGGGGQGDTSGYKYYGAWGGSGGFGAGGGRGFRWYSSGGNGPDGYGASNGFGAGMGGGVFIRSGEVTIKNSHFSSNTATASAEAKGLGGGLFVLHSAVNQGSNIGMPYSIPKVTACGIEFDNNSARDDSNSGINNNDFFAISNNLRGFNGAPIEEQCPIVDTISNLEFETTPNTMTRVASSSFTGPPVCVENQSIEPRCTVIPYDTSRNKAYLGNQSAISAVANSMPVLPEDFFLARNLNDGLYGNGSAWLSNLPVGAVNNWVKIDLGVLQDIQLVKFGRDRNPVGLVTRGPGQFQIWVATTDDIYAHGNDQNDGSEYRLVFRSLDFGFDGLTNEHETIQASFSQISARYIKVVFENSRAIIDEIEVE